MALLYQIAVFVVAAYFFYRRLSLYSSRRKFIEQNGCQTAKSRYPQNPLYFGVDFMLANLGAVKERRFLEIMQQRFERLGNTYFAQLPGRDIIVTCEPENFKTILSIRFNDYVLGDLRVNSFGQLVGTSIFTSDGEAWRASRQLLRPQFAKEQIADLQAFEGHIQDLFKLIPQDGSTVDLQELFFRFTLDSATEFLIGRSVHTLREEMNSEKEKRFAKAFNYASDYAIKLFRLAKLSKFYRDSKGTEAIRFIQDYVDQFVNEALRSKETGGIDKTAHGEKYIFLQELVKATEDRKVIRDELLALLIAGRDTTACLLSNLFFVLSRRPDIWKKLRTEVAGLNGALPSYEHLRDLKYVKYCLNESLRCHPVIPGNSRLAAVDTVLPVGGGPDGKSPIMVPKGCVILYITWALHQRKDIYGPDADEFRPERWETLRPVAWEYVPFNGGPRICIGQQYALTEASYILVRMAQEFSTIEPRDSLPWREQLAVTLCSAGGVKAELTRA